MTQIYDKLTLKPTITVCFETLLLLSVNFYGTLRPRIMTREFLGVLGIPYPGCWKMCPRIGRLELQLINSVAFPFPGWSWLSQSPLNIFYLNVEVSPSSHPSVASTMWKNSLKRKCIYFYVCSSFFEEKLLIKLFNWVLFQYHMSVWKEISIRILWVNRCGFQGNTVHTAVIEIFLDCQSLKGVFIPLLIPLQIDLPRVFTVCI